MQKPGYQAFSFIPRASPATANLLFCRLTENVGVVPLFSFLEVLFCLFLRGLLQDYSFYTTQFIFGFLLSKKLNC